MSAEGHADHIRQAEEAVRASPFWAGRPVTAARVDGGLTNINFRVECGGKTYFARRAVDRPDIGIDRANELACHRAAAERG